MEVRKGALLLPEIMVSPAVDIAFEIVAAAVEQVEPKIARYCGSAIIRNAAFAPPSGVQPVSIENRETG